jgi:hypothetical protein
MRTICIPPACLSADMLKICDKPYLERYDPLKIDRATLWRAD